jgi:hypothetical protein
MLHFAQEKQYCMMQRQPARAIALQGYVGSAFLDFDQIFCFLLRQLVFFVHILCSSIAQHGSAMEDNVFEMKLRIQQLEEKLAYLAGGTNGDELASIIMEKDEEIAKMVRYYMQQCCRRHAGFTTNLKALTDV